MCHALIVTNEAATAQLGERLTEVPRVRSSALALYRAPVGAAPNFQRAHCQSSAEFLQELLSRSSHGRLHCNECNALKCSDLRRSLSYENSVIRNLFHECLLGQTLG